MLRKLFLGLVPIILFTGCAVTSKPATNITLEATDFAYSPALISVPLGEPITVTIKNDGKVEHDFVVQKIDVMNVVQQGNGMDMGHDMSSMEYDLHISTLPGESSTITFTPTEAGTYEFFCTVEGHKEAGMVGNLIISNTQQ